MLLFCRLRIAPFQITRTARPRIRPLFQPAVIAACKCELLAELLVFLYRFPEQACPLSGGSGLTLGQRWRRLAFGVRQRRNPRISLLVNNVSIGS